MTKSVIRSNSEAETKSDIAEAGIVTAEAETKSDIAEADIVTAEAKTKSDIAEADIVMTEAETNKSDIAEADYKNLGESDNKVESDKIHEVDYENNLFILKNDLSDKMLIYIALASAEQPDLFKESIHFKMHIKVFHRTPEGLKEYRDEEDVQQYTREI